MFSIYSLRNSSLTNIISPIEVARFSEREDANRYIKTKATECDEDVILCLVHDHSILEVLKGRKVA